MKFISSENLTKQLHTVVKKIDSTTNSPPIIVPLDLYNISSELSFYQAKLFDRGNIDQLYPIIGRHIFGKELMYRYWSTELNLSGKTLILISPQLKDFKSSRIHNKTIAQQTSPRKLWSHSQGRNIPIVPYYYQVVQMK